MNSECAEMDYLQELSNRHDEVMEKLDELERKISSVLDEYLGKAESVAESVQKNMEEI